MPCLPVAAQLAWKLPALGGLRGTGRPGRPEQAPAAHLCVEALLQSPAAEQQ